MQPLCIPVRMAKELLRKIGTKSMAWNYVLWVEKGSDGNAINDGHAIC